MAALASTAEGAIISSPSSTTLLIAVHRVPWRFFSNSTVVHIKVVHVSKTTPLLGVICPRTVPPFLVAILDFAVLVCCRFDHTPKDATAWPTLSHDLALRMRETANQLPTKGRPCRAV